MAEDEQGYSWETEYERSWEILKEDDAGLLEGCIDNIVSKEKRRKLLEHPSNVRLGMMRHMYLILDMSKVMDDQDLKPNRITVSLKLLENFVTEFFDQNPVSQLGVLAMRNKRVEKISELGGNCKRHLACLEKLKESSCLGESSLQNALELANQSLRHMPAHASREVLIIFGSLATCDPGNIFDTIKMLRSNNIQCSIIGLGASIHVCQQICIETLGKYHVILDESHFRELLVQHMTPPTATVNTASSLLKMGFPHHEAQSIGDGQPSMCMCHLDSKSLGQGFGKDGYFCPQCCSKYCDLPCECVTCGLTLVSAPHLARSYHHLFPLPSFTEVLTSDIFKQNRYCYGCQRFLTDVHAYKCSTCTKVFCIDCDIFIHSTLHSCPGCASNRTA